METPILDELLATDRSKRTRAIHRACIFKHGALMDEITCTASCPENDEIYELALEARVWAYMSRSEIQFVWDMGSNQSAG